MATARDDSVAQPAREDKISAEISAPAVRVCIKPSVK
jgi:hypothetical protein